MADIDDIDGRILERIQDDLPVEKRPFDAWAGELGLGTEELIARLVRLKQSGIIRSVKAIVRHRRAGFSSGAMVTWAVPEEQVGDIGRRMASRQEISHCYERSGFGEYNLFSMIHGRTNEEVLRIIGEVASSLGLSRYQVYWSIQELKKSSMKYDKGDLR
jgi:DNA-binding Lrp family transcriptional regulator